MSTKRIRAVIHGRVQRVAFREYTRQEANRLGLSGWVKNQADGTVAVLCEGEASRVDTLVSWLSVGSPFAVVSHVECVEENFQGEYATFVIRY